MKSKILTLLLVLGCCGFVFSQVTDTACPGTTAPAINEAAVGVCPGVDDPQSFTAAGSNLPDTEFIVEVNGMIVEVNADGSFDESALAPGDVVTVSAVSYDIAGVNQLLADFQGLCGFAETLGQVPAGTCATLYDPPPAGLGGMIANLSDVLDVAAALGAPIGAVSDIQGIIDGINAQVGGFGLPAICYGISAPVTYVVLAADDAACVATCDPAISTTTAPAAIITSESTCEADGMTLSGGVIDPPATACPTGSTLEYSIDAGATWSATLPTYDQMVAVTVDTRCVCDTDATDISATASVTTVPGMCPTCDAIAASTAPTAVVTSESTCEADGVTLSGGVIAPPTMGCPTGSTLEYSTDGGATWSATLPAYDQMAAVTVDTRCLCDLDGTTASATASVTTVPGMCAVVDCGITAGEPAMATADVCLQDIGTVDVTGIFADAGPAGTPSLVQNYAVTDMATGDLITISNSATLDLTGAQVGTVACVTAIAYTQETLDVITAAIDNVTQIPLSPIPPLGSLDLSGFLNGLNGAFEVVGIEFTAADIQSWCETQTLTIPFSALPGGLIPDLTLDLMTLIPPSGFCCDFSNSDYCLTVIDCSTPCDPATCNNVTVTITSAMLDTSDPGFNEGFPGDNTTETVFIINGVQFFADVTNSGGVEAVTLTPCAGNTFVVGPTSICADAPAVTVDMLVFDDDDAGDGRCDPFDPDAGIFGAEGDDEIWPDNSGANPGAAGAVPFDLTATSFTGGPITIEYTVSCEAVTCEPCPACDPLVSTTTAPPAVVTSESTCEADGVTLSGGVIDVPATACPTGSTLEYSIDAGATWSTTLPTYDQMTAVTVDTRCVCDSDATDISVIASVTTVPGMCMTAVCEADAPELDPATGDCAADDGDMMETPFTWPLNAASTENTTAPYITEYIVTDAASGTIIGVFSTLAAAEAAANTEITDDVDGNATACIQPINHDSANLEAVIADIDAQSNGLICGVLPCPVTTLEAFYTAAAGLGAALDVATVVSIIGPPNVGATGLDLGAALGLPPGALVVDVMPFCYELGVEVCATNAACPAMCDPAIAAATAPAATVPSESTCEADGTTLSGGVIAAPVGTCPTGSTLEYSTDGGGTWSATLPTYNQTTAVTVDTRCVCSIDATIFSATASVTTVPGMCTGGGCSISVSITNFACDDGGTPDDASDDMVTFDYTVNDIGGTGTTWSSDQGDAAVAYGTTVSVSPIMADGSAWSINVTDDGDATCTASASQVLSDCATVDNIPTVGEWGLIMLGLLMSITAIVGIRQRREEEVYG